VLQHARQIHAADLAEAEHIGRGGVLRLDDGRAQVQAGVEVVQRLQLLTLSSCVLLALPLLALLALLLQLQQAAGRDPRLGHQPILGAIHAGHHVRPPQARHHIMIHARFVQCSSAVQQTARRPRSRTAQEGRSQRDQGDDPVCVRQQLRAQLLPRKACQQLRQL
jgi:hypothetical protein